jgi:hypothetical protein
VHSCSPRAVGGRRFPMIHLTATGSILLSPGFQRGMPITIFVQVTEHSSGELGRGWMKLLEVGIAFRTQRALLRRRALGHL